MNYSLGHAYHQGNPTVRPAYPFEPNTDAEVLRKAMKGFGTDEKAIIKVLANRSNVQRQEIALSFKTMYGKDLVENLKSELSGNFLTLILALMTPALEYLAKELHHAVSGLGTDEHALIQIVCTSSNYEMQTICQVYQHLYSRSLEQDLKGDTSGCFKRLMVSSCQGCRSEDETVDPEAALRDAEALYNAGELVLGTDESVFNSILCTRSYCQLQQIFYEYRSLTGNGIENAIEAEFSGHIKSGLLAIVRTVHDRTGYFAEQLYKSMKGLGTDDRALIRIIVSRSEIDLEDIKHSFQQKYGQSLAEWVKDDTSGDYKRCLLEIIK